MIRVSNKGSRGPTTPGLLRARLRDEFNAAIGGALSGGKLIHFPDGRIGVYKSSQINNTTSPSATVSCYECTGRDIESKDDPRPMPLDFYSNLLDRKVPISYFMVKRPAFEDDSNY